MSRIDALFILITQAIFGNIIGVVTSDVMSNAVAINISFCSVLLVISNYQPPENDIKHTESKPVTGQKMTTQSSPIITDMKVIPVAGHDSMLLNIGGAHNAYFTRNIVVLTDNAGHTGIGEAPGGEVIYQTLVDAIPMVLGQEIARLNKLVQQVHKGNQAADFDTFGKGAWTFELRVNAVAALEAALLDLLGKALNVPVCELLGPGK